MSWVPTSVCWVMMVLILKNASSPTFVVQNLKMCPQKYRCHETFAPQVELRVFGLRMKLVFFSYFDSTSVFQISELIHVTTWYKRRLPRRNKQKKQLNE